MARTVLTTQRLANKSGQQITFAPIDTINGHQYRNTGVEVILLRLDSASGVTLNIPSVADTFNRTGDISAGFTGAFGSGSFPPSTLFAVGPFSPPQIWGDGSLNNQINESALTGSGGIAVIAI